MSIFTILFVILLIAWVLGWGVLHVTSAMIHILLVVALISLILHFVRGPRAV
ncbi:MAG TPA: lmo0937 family membrane protein [Terriglobales bacterium]|nr:lmo0937 family membrane protein [Terriglobales bacterium]